MGYLMVDVPQTDDIIFHPALLAVAKLIQLEGNAQPPLPSAPGDALIDVSDPLLRMIAGSPTLAASVTTVVDLQLSDPNGVPLDDPLAGVVVEAASPTASQALSTIGLQYVTADIWIGKLGLSRVQSLSDLDGVNTVSLSYLNRQALNVSIQPAAMSDLDGLWDGVAKLKLPPLDGSGVIAATIDENIIDYTHADFRDPSTTRTRFDRIMDYAQTPPMEYSACDINYALGFTCDCGSCKTLPAPTSLERHATMVMSAFAGNGQTNVPYLPLVPLYRGPAISSPLLYVRLPPGSPDASIIQAINYVFQGPSPTVLDLSLGRYTGSHDGTDLISKTISSILVNRPNSLILVSAGNGLGTNSPPLSGIHAGTSLGVGVGKWVAGVRPSPGPPSKADVDAWYQLPGSSAFDIAACVESSCTMYVAPLSSSEQTITPPGEITQLVAHGGTSSLVNFTDSNGTSSCLISVTQSGIQSNGANNALILTSSPCSIVASHRILVKFVPETSFYQAGTIDLYLPDLSMTFLTGADINLPRVDAGSLVNLATGPHVVAVGGYEFDRTLQTSNYLSEFSSLGPTRDGRKKPELTAPGGGSGSYLDMAAPVRVYGTGQGTSFAAPIAAGAGALLMQYVISQGTAQPSAQLLSNTLCAGARGDSYTSSQVQATRQYFSPPSDLRNEWGCGKLDILGAIETYSSYRSLTRLFQNVAKMLQGGGCGCEEIGVGGVYGGLVPFLFLIWATIGWKVFTRARRRGVKIKT